MSRDLSKEGERVGSSGYAGYYDYAIDAGFNPNGIKNQGSALFLHCSGEFKEYTSGCVAIEKEPDGPDHEAVWKVRQRRILYRPGTERNL